MPDGIPAPETAAAGHAAAGDSPGGVDGSVYREVVESAADPIYRVDSEGRLAFVNPAVARLTGMPASELIGTRWVDLVRPDHRERVAEVYARQLEEGADDGYCEFPIVTPSGEDLWLGQKLQRLTSGSSGTVLQALAHDITERHLAEEKLRASEERFRQLAEHGGGCFWMLDPAQDEIVYASPSFDTIWGRSREAVLGSRESWLASIHPDDRERLTAVLPRRRVEDFDEVYRIIKPDGTTAWIRDRSYPILDADGNVLRIAGMAEDVTDRQAAEEHSVRLAALTRENPNPVLQCDADGRPLNANPAAEQVCFELGLGDIMEILPPNHEQLVHSTLDTGEGLQHVDVDVGERIFSWTYRPDQEAGLVYLFAVDVTGRRLMEEQLRHDTLHDALTGLPNRLLFMERLSHCIARSKRRDSYLFAVLFLDLDRFKVINDSLGHHVGDELLVLVAQRLQRCLRQEDTVARFGGDEFAILLEDISGISDATRVAERIQAELSASVSLNEFDVFTSASVGIALSSSAYARPEFLLRNADMAMYRAKALGHARFEVFDRTMHAQALARLQLETDLRHALERKEFVLHYQPIISLSSGEICGVEALIRWVHPVQGILPPDDFIPAAEETGLILPIGRWVLGEACRRLRRWRVRFGEGRLRSVGVNLSAKQFSQIDLLEQVWDTVRDSGLPPDVLRLEITESAVMENADAAVILLGRLKGLGVQISLDDFGTGYSSLSYLHRFPLDALKIDRSFVGQIDLDERTRRLVETVLTLARGLGVSAVAEGIETEGQLKHLRALGCDFGQGYYFAPPLPPEELEALLDGDPTW
ncbi:MAG: EAL domain-containing protein [Gemmatimonadetes bacterium]|nr:EAL domain-containing protein [Gemmatimonadota bacterium]